MFLREGHFTMHTKQILNTIVVVLLAGRFVTGQDTTIDDDSHSIRRYSIVAGDDARQFQIDAVSGKITVNQDANRSEVKSKTVIVAETVSEPIGGDIASDAFSQHAEQLGFPDLKRETVRRVEVEVQIEHHLASSPSRPRAVPMPRTIIPFTTLGAPIAAAILDQGAGQTVEAKIAASENTDEQPLEPIFAEDKSRLIPTIEIEPTLAAAPNVVPFSNTRPDVEAEPTPTLATEDVNQLPFIANAPSNATEVEPTLAALPMVITPAETTKIASKTQSASTGAGPLAAPANATATGSATSFAYVDPVATFVVLMGLLFILWKTLSPIAALNRFLNLFNSYDCTYEMGNAMTTSNVSLGKPNGDPSDSFEEIDLNADGIELAQKANRSMYDSIENLELVHAELSSLNWDSIGSEPFDSSVESSSATAVAEATETEQFAQEGSHAAMDLARAINDRDQLLKQTSEFRQIANGSARSAIRTNRVKDTPKQLVGGLGLLLANVGSAYYAWSLTGWASVGMGLCAVGISIVAIRSLRKTFDSLMWYFASGPGAK